MATLRHAGVLVKDLNNARVVYEQMGYTPVAPIETLCVLKMRDAEGATIELVQGNWHPHIAVNWLADEDGNYIEIVEEKRDEDNRGDRHKPQRGCCDRKEADRNGGAVRCGCGQVPEADYRQGLHQSILK